MIEKISKGLPKWVRENYGKYRWEYQKDGKYYAQGFYKTAQEAHEACIEHQRNMERYNEIFRNPLLL